MVIPSAPDKALPFETVLRDGDVLAVARDETIVVQCLVGQVWITEESDARDYVVPECAYYRPRGTGRIVVSGMATSSRIRIVRLAPAQTKTVKAGVSIGLECAERLRRAAQRDAASSVGRWLMRGGRAIRRLLSLDKMVVPCHSLHGDCA
jgi:hypothetical protein